MAKHLKLNVSVAVLIAATAGLTTQAHAEGKSAAKAFYDEIVVSATKKADLENVQDVPLAVTAFGAEQLEAIKVRDLQSLTYSMPNVSFDDIGTTKGVANFSIRGLGINSSIPSIDPTVGVFVDGMYLGVNIGVVFDIFDMESIEVLRGPQGILFGRNTTGGAVLINTRKPTDEFEVNVKTAVESGFRGTGTNYYAMGSVSGPLVEDKLSAKIVAYYDKDEGWHNNYLGGDTLEDHALALGGTIAFLQSNGYPIATNKPNAYANQGAAESLIVRPSLYWTPNEMTEVTLRYEHGHVKGDGPAGQNHPGGNGIPNIFYSADRDSFDFSIDEIGYYDNTWNQAIVDARIDLGENGVITNIVGWRELDSDARSDIDATPFFLFNGDLLATQEQISEELRYNNRVFNTADITLGVFYFDQDISYNEDRDLLGGYLFYNGGGVQDQTTYAAFGQVDYDVSDVFTINVGARYTHESKNATISNLLLNTVDCDVNVPGDCSEDFKDKDTWNSLTPKVGFTWNATDDLNIYAHWTKGVRSGGYNFRNGSLAYAPGPTDEEVVNAYELGIKAQPLEGRATINFALFRNDVSDMQREINLSDPIVGVVQLIRNTADATIWGFELETRFAITDDLMLLASAGHTEGEYDNIVFDLTGDGIVDSADEALKIPRLAPWTYSIGLVHSYAINNDLTLNSRINYSHRDKAFYTDNNLGFLNEVDIIDAGLSLDWDTLSVSLYGKNLLNEVSHGGDSQLPGSLGYGSGGPLNKGRVIGLELKKRF